MRPRQYPCGFDFGLLVVVLRRVCAGEEPVPFLEIPMFALLTALRRAHALSVCLILAGLGVSCASVHEPQLAPDEVLDALDQRVEGPARIFDALDLAGLDVLALPRPTPEECADPRSAGYWRACALAWNPSVRAARRELERALAAANLAGQPQAIEGGIESMDLSDIERETKVSVTFDLLGLLGLGPAQVAREAARVDVLRAHSRLESAVWSAIFDVERARVRLAAARKRQAELAELLEQVVGQSARFEVLERRGRLSEADVASVAAAAHEVEHAISSEKVREAGLQAELARVSGLAFEHAAFGAVGGEVLKEASAGPGERSARQVLEQDPALRELTLEFAQAEMRVRAVAASAWPTLRAGPQLTFMPSDLLVGGLLDLSVPWPGTVEKQMRVARVEREAARERVEDALQFALARVASLREILGEQKLLADEHAPELDEAEELTWQAVNARLRYGRATAMEWTLAARARKLPLVGLVDAREAAELAALDLAQACGIATTSEEVAP